MTPAREAFEAWYQSTHTSAPVRRTKNGYIDNATRVAWRAWQAATGMEREACAAACDDGGSDAVGRCYAGLIRARGTP